MCKKAPATSNLILLNVPEKLSAFKAQYFQCYALEYTKKRSAVPVGFDEIYDMERRSSAETAECSRLAGQEPLPSQCLFSKPLLGRDSTEDIRENDHQKLQEVSSNTYA